MADREGPKPGDTLYLCENVYGSWRVKRGKVVELPEANPGTAVFHWDSCWVATRGTTGWHATPEEAVKPHRERMTARWKEQMEEPDGLLAAGNILAARSESKKGGTE